MNATAEPPQGVLSPPVPDQGFHWRVMVLADHDGGRTARVGSLVRALRTLGHHVLELDAGRHGLRGHRPDPEDTDGARSAVATVRLDRLQPMVDAFDPQIVLALGAPMDFAPQDAARLRAAGRVLVGVWTAAHDHGAAAHDGAPHDTPFPVAASGTGNAHALADGPAGSFDLLRVTGPEPADQAGTEGNSHAWTHSAGEPDEDRWMDLFARLRAAGAEDLPWLDEGRRDEIRTVLARSLPRAKKVLVSGYYGAGNLGDELILSSIVQALQRADPAVQVTVAAERPLAVEKSHGLQAYSRPDHRSSLDQVRTAAAVVLGGGGLWHDHSFARSGGLMGFSTGARMSIAGYGTLPLQGRMLGVPFHVVGMGVGPLTTPDSRAAVRFLADQADSVYVRERASAELLASLPFPAERIVTGPDVVYGVDLPAPDPGLLPAGIREAAEAGHRLIGLNLRSWDAGDLDALIRSTTQALVALAARQPLAVVSIPMQAGRGRDDEVTRRVLDALPPDVQGIEFGHRPSLSELVSVYDRLDALVSMRLHAALIAHRVGLPTVGLAYDPKVTRHFAEVGRTDSCLRLDAPADRIAELLTRSLGQDLPGPSRRAVSALEAQTASALAGPADRIAALPTPLIAHRPPADPGGQATGPATPETKARPAVAAFTAMESIVEPAAPAADRSRATRSELQWSLATRHPRRGMSAGWTGRLEVTGAGTHAVDLVLHNHWSNARARGRVFVELAAGDAAWRQDLSESADPVTFRVLVREGSPVPLTVRVVVQKTAFRSPSWTSATRCRLVLGDVTRIPPPAPSEPALFVSAGTLRPHG